MEMFNNIFFRLGETSSIVNRSFIFKNKLRCDSNGDK